MAKTSTTPPLSTSKHAAPGAASTNSSASPAPKGGKTRPAEFYQPNAHSLRQENNIGRLIKQVYASINRMIDLGVTPLGLTAMQWKPLVMICHNNFDTPAELSRHCNVDTGAMTRTLDRLEAKGFLTRHRCAEDRRVVKLTLTDSGRKVVDGIFPAVADTLNTHLNGFSKDEIGALFNLLNRMAANGACKSETGDPDGS